MPEISVIIPVYNVESYLEQCLDSVVKQTFSDIEIICVDDGSTDKSSTILAEYARSDKRIKVITQENKGLSAARNAGVSAATANYISFIDSDDFVCPSFLETLYSAMKKNDSDIAGCDFLKIIKDEKLAPSQLYQVKVYSPALDVLLHKNNFIHFNVWNKLYKRDVIKDISFVEGIYYEDWVFNCQVFTRAKNFAWINAPLYGYRMTDNSIMRSSYNLKKMNDYVTGIKEVYGFMQNKDLSLWEKVKKTRISRTVKMMMNSALRSNNQDVMSHTREVLHQLYENKLINYSGLSLRNKIKLYKFLH